MSAVSIMSEFNGSNYFQERHRPKMAKLFDDVASKVVDLLPPENWQKEFLELQARSYRGVFESENAVYGRERWYADFRRDQTDTLTDAAITELCIIRLISDQDAEIFAIKQNGTYRRARAYADGKGGHTYHQLYSWPGGFDAIGDRLYKNGELQLNPVDEDETSTNEKAKLQDVAFQMSNEYSEIKTSESMDYEYAKNHSIGLLALRLLKERYEQRRTREYYYSFPTIRVDRITKPYKDINSSVQENDSSASEAANNLITTEQMISAMASATHSFVNKIFALENQELTDVIYDTGSVIIQNETGYWRITIDKTIGGVKLAKIENLVTDVRANPYHSRYSYSIEDGNSYIKQQRMGREVQPDIAQTMAEDYLDSPGMVMDFCQQFTYKYTDATGQKLLWKDAIVVNEKQGNKLEQIDCNWRQSVNGDECECYQEHGTSSRVRFFGQGVTRLFKRGT